MDHHVLIYWYLLKHIPTMDNLAMGRVVAPTSYQIPCGYKRSNIEES